MILLGSNEI